jgi:hypothetical protein
LNVYTAEPGSTSQQAPDLLASWTATLAEEEQPPRNRRGVTRLMTHHDAGASALSAAS